MGAALLAGTRLGDMGLGVVTVRLAGVSPSAELARALETPTFERAQERGRRGLLLARRALAVEKERAIAENELSTKVELARRQAALIAQEDENARRAPRAAPRPAASAPRAQAAGIRVLEAARNAAEGDRLALLSGVDPAVLHAITPRARSPRS